MKKSIIIASAAVFMALGAVNASAQDKKMQDNQKEGRPLPQALVERMASVVELNGEQKEKLLDVFAEAMEKQEEYRKELKEDIMKIIGSQKYDAYQAKEAAEAQKRAKSSPDSK